MTTQFNKQASITEPILEALPSLAAGGLLARTAYKLDDIVEAVARRKHLQEALPELAKTLPKHEVKTLVNEANNKLIASTIPFGSTAAKTIDNIKANRYIAKEMQEVENLLKNPGENYKIGHVKEANAITGIGKFVGKNLGTLGGAVAGGYGANSMLGDEASGIQRAGAIAGGALAGAIGGRGLARGMHMGLGTNYGKALVNQRGSRGLVRQAFGGFSAPKGSTSGYIRDTLPKINQANMANAEKGLQSHLEKDIAAGGMGLSNTSATAANKELLSGAGAQEGFLKNVKQRFDLASRLQPESAATRNMLMGSTAGALGGGYAGYQASNENPYAAAAGAVTGGILGGFGGYKGYAGITGRALFNKNDTLRSRYLQGMQTNPELLQQNLNRVNRNMSRGVDSGSLANKSNISKAQSQLQARQAAQEAALRSRDNAQYSAATAERLSNEAQTRLRSAEEARNIAKYNLDNSKTVVGRLYRGGISKLRNYQAQRAEARRQAASDSLTKAERKLLEEEGKYTNAQGEASAAELEAAKAKQTAEDYTKDLGQRISDIQTNLAIRQSGTAMPATKNVITVGDAPGTLKFVGAEGAGNLSLSADAARNLGAKNPELVADKMNNSIGKLSAPLQENVSKALNKGGPESQQLVDTLTAHAKEVAAVSNKVHDDVANAITSQASYISKQSFSGLPGLEVPAERLTSTPAFKELVNEVSKGTALDAAGIKTILQEAGYTAPAAQLDQLSANLATALNPIAKNAAAKLDAASSALQRNVAGTLTNISAAGHAAESKALQAAFTNARATMPASELNKLETELQQAMELANKQGGESLDKMQGLMSNARKALQNGDSNAVNAAINEIQNFSKPLMQKTPGFQSYTTKLTNQAGKVFNDIGDDFASQASAYLPEGSQLLTNLEKIQNLSPAARNAIAKSNFNSLNLAETSEALKAVGKRLPALKSYPALGSLKPKQMNSVGQIIAEVNPQILRNISGSKNSGVAQQLIADLQQAGVTFSAPPTTKELTEVLAQFSKYQREAKSTLDTAVKGFKASFKAEAASGPLLTAPTGGIGQRASVQLDQAALDKANAAGRTLFPTEAPVVQEISQTAAPVSQQAQAAAQQMTQAPVAQQVARPISGAAYGLGALGVGGAGYGGYQFLNQAATQAPVQQFTQAPLPLTGYYNRSSY